MRGSFKTFSMQTITELACELLLDEGDLEVGGPVADNFPTIPPNRANIYAYFALVE